MRIHDQNLAGASAAGTGRASETQRTSGGSAASSSTRAGADRVEFSGALSAISRALSADSSNRAARVDALAAAYQNGTYRPDAAATSRAMVADALASAVG